MNNLKFTETHEWVRLEEDGLVIGITNYAQGELGDVVYVELPEIGKILCKGDGATVIESVKSAGDIKMPVSGKVVAINENLQEEPGVINTDSEGDGWLFMVSAVSDSTEEFDALMDADAYDKFLSGL